MKEIFNENQKQLIRVYCRCCSKNHWMDISTINFFNDTEYLIEFKERVDHYRTSKFERFKEWSNRFLNPNENTILNSVFLSPYQVEEMLSVFINEFKAPNPQTNWKFLPWPVEANGSFDWVEAIVYRSNNGLEVTVEGFYKDNGIHDIEIIFSYKDPQLFKDKKYFKRVSWHYILNNSSIPFIENDLIIRKEEMKEIVVRLLKLSNMVKPKVKQYKDKSYQTLYIPWQK